MSLLAKLVKVFKVITWKKFSKCPDGPVTNWAEERALKAGLINSEQIMAYCDSYTTGLTKDNLADGLDSYWDIRSPQEAAETLTLLSRYGHRFFYDIVFRVYSECASEDRPQEILEALVASGRYGPPEEVMERISAAEPSEEKDLVLSAHQQAMVMFHHLSSVFRLLKDKVNGPYLQKDYSAGILAWDLGRLVTVARMSFDCKFIEQSDLNQILEHVDGELRTNFSSWTQFAKSYIVGRAVWSGQDMMLGGLIGIAEDLMTDKESPWILSPL